MSVTEGLAARLRAARETSRRNHEITSQTRADYARHCQEAERRARREREGGQQRAYPDDWQQRLGIQVRGGQAWEWSSGKHLGPLAGARAGMTAALRRAGQAAGSRAKASTHVTFTSGVVVITSLDNSRSIAQAQTDVVRFNALAGACRTAAAHDR
jgi:hypothetical protein